ncbi:MAG: N-acetylmuramoyl-L-alanine amidase [Oscillospiraceae bacterium]|nr:N-acetylmuramoyl-L-alanine amidase [Oscillospiraceae bacterium]
MTALQIGTATITFTAQDGGGAMATASITVAEPQLITSIRLPDDNITMYVDDYVAINPIVLPVNADNRELEVIICDPEIVQYEDGMLIGLATGTATITLVALDGSGVYATGTVTVQAVPFGRAMFEAFSDSRSGCGSTAVTGVRIGVRTNNETRPVLSNGQPRPFTVFYNATSHADHTVRLTANISPSSASNLDVTWTSAQVLNTANPSTLPTPSGTVNTTGGTQTNHITVRPQITNANNNAGRFVREYRATTADGSFVARQIVIGVARIYPHQTYTALRAVDVFSGPFSSELATFPRVATLSAGTQVSLRGQYNNDWFYITWGNNNWGYVRLRDAGNFGHPRPEIRPSSDWRNATTPIPATGTARGTARRVIFHHNAGRPLTSTTLADTRAYIRGVHPGGTGDIAYHFLIDRAGRIWEGRPLNRRGAHTSGSHGGFLYNDDIGVALLGNYHTHHPQHNQHQNPNAAVQQLTQAQRDAMTALSRYFSTSMNLQIVTNQPHSPVAMHFELPGAIATDCPGVNVIPWIRDTLRPQTNAWLRHLR